MKNEVQDCYGKTYAVKWKEVTEERFDEMLGALPPIAFSHSGFLVGEAWTHRIINGRERAAYMGLKRFDGKFYECLAPLTVDEFININRNEVLAEVTA